MTWELVKMSWEDIFKMKCIMCGAKLEKVSGKNKKAYSRGNSQSAKYKCPECGHTEIFR